jgi:hypothetical protein
VTAIIPGVPSMHFNTLAEKQVSTNHPIFL